MSIYADDTKAAREIVNLVGKNIVIGVPLGLGKPIGIINALYRLAAEDSSIQLTIITGLTFARPVYKNPLEKNLVAPILERLMGDYEDPLYEKARILQQLPANITVIEFFLSPGKFLNNQYVQRNYISSCYTNVVRDCVNLSINVIAQMVSSQQVHPDVYSLSCNSDLFHDTCRHLKIAEKAGKKIAIVAEVNSNLPYMYGDSAEVDAGMFAVILDTKKYKPLFAVPRDELSVQDHLIGIYASTLIVDDGCLQIGIGKLSNALANALIFRHRNNDLYVGLLQSLGKASESLGVFDKGLYASTEMLSDEYMSLYKEGILKKKVYDHIGLQRLLNTHKISEVITPETIQVLIDNNIIHADLTADDVKFLQRFGIFKSDISLDKHSLILANGESIPADLSVPANKNKIIEKCLGGKLISGKLVHAGFYFGSVDLYSWLKNLPRSELRLIDMTSVQRTNSLFWSPELLSLQRENARFVNSTLMVTLLGGVISDGLTNYQEVSGVGGQYDFVSMATQLQCARSIITCRSTRETKDGVVSNIIWDYANSTLPRYLRDIVVTEYGVADCRSKTDEEVIKVMLNIADSRFQQGLLNAAKKAGKLARDYQIPEAYQRNYPESIRHAIHALHLENYFQPYPFGSDLTVIEQGLARALLYLKNQSGLKLVSLVLRAIFSRQSTPNMPAYLQRIKLDKPKNARDFIYQKLLQYVLNKQAAQ